MYHKSRRKQRQFYPEFYDDDEIDIKKDIELNLESEPDENMQETAAEQEIPANYNDLLYPSRIKTDSVFKQLENMQKDYIQKKLVVSHANNISINPEITGSDKTINRNEAVAMNENNNEIRIEIPDSMYTDEIQELHNNITEENITDESINEVAECMTDVDYTDDANNAEILYEMNYTAAEDVLSTPMEVSQDVEVMVHTDNRDNTDNFTKEIKDLKDYLGEDLEVDFENPGEAVETFEHMQPPETYKITSHVEEFVPKPEQFEHHEPPVLQFEPQIENFSVEESVVERDYSPHHSSMHEYKTKLIPFDKVKAIEYAHRWALDRNPNFLDFDELGGDCTNYISQILLAGGCKMDYTPVYGWYYSSGSEKSPSWTGVEQLYNYLIKEKEYGIIAKEINAEEAQAGDIVQLSFNGRNFQHTPFIVEVSQSAGVPFHFDSIKICAHSFDSQNRALDTYQWRKIRFIHILGYSEK